MDAVTDLIDAFLNDTKNQTLIDRKKVTDFLLDLRLLVMVPDTVEGLETPVGA